MNPVSATKETEVKSPAPDSKHYSLPVSPYFNLYLSHIFLCDKYNKIKSKFGKIWAKVALSTSAANVISVPTKLHLRSKISAEVRSVSARPANHGRGSCPIPD